MDDAKFQVVTVAADGSRKYLSYGEARDLIFNAQLFTLRQDGRSMSYCVCDAFPTSHQKFRWYYRCRSGKCRTAFALEGCTRRMNADSFENDVDRQKELRKCLVSCNFINPADRHPAGICKGGKARPRLLPSQRIAAGMLFLQDPRKRPKDVAQSLGVDDITLVRDIKRRCLQSPVTTSHVVQLQVELQDHFANFQKDAIVSDAVQTCRFEDLHCPFWTLFFPSRYERAVSLAANPAALDVSFEFLYKLYPCGWPCMSCSVIDKWGRLHTVCFAAAITDKPAAIRQILVSIEAKHGFRYASAVCDGAAGWASLATPRASAAVAAQASCEEGSSSAVNAAAPPPDATVPEHRGAVPVRMCWRHVAAAVERRLVRLGIAAAERTKVLQDMETLHAYSDPDEDKWGSLLANHTASWPEAARQYLISTWCNGEDYRSLWRLADLPYPNAASTCGGSEIVPRYKDTGSNQRVDAAHLFAAIAEILLWEDANTGAEVLLELAHDASTSSKYVAVPAATATAGGLAQTSANPLSI